MTENNIPEEQQPQEAPAETPVEEINPERARAESYLDQLLRLQAEFANFRKRSEKEKADAMRYGRLTTLEHLIGMLDVMEQALKHAETATDVKSMQQGFKMVVSEFNRFLKSEGAEPIQSVGATFDPHLHEAVDQSEADCAENHNKIVEEYQKGYRFQDRLLRPARVKVAKLKEEKI